MNLDLLSESRKIAILFLCVLFELAPRHTFAAQEGPQGFTLEGKLYNAAGTAPELDTVDFVFDIYNQNENCLLYEEAQPNINLIPTNGDFALTVGSATGPGKRTVNDPGQTLANIFSNTGSLAIPVAVCPGTPYLPSTGEIRYLRVFVTPHSTGLQEQLSPDLAINAAPTSTSAETLLGIGPTGFINVDIPNHVTQANMALLVGNTDITGNNLHNHDSRYAQLNTVGGSQNLGSGNLLLTGDIGINAPVPAADLDIERVNPTIQLGASAGGTSALNFHSNTLGAVSASIQGSDASNTLTFLTGGSQAMQITNTQNVSFSKSVVVTGTLQVGQYSTAQEGAVLNPFLTGAGAAALGTIWANSSTPELRYWDGAAMQTIESVSALNTTLGNYLKTDGSVAMTGANPLNIGTNKVINVVDPTNPQDAATKNYVDGHLAGSPLTVAGLANGQALVWNNVATQWQPGNVGGNPAGGDKAVQYDNSGAFAGDTANFVWDYTTHRLGLGIAAPGNQLTLNTPAVADATAQELITTTAIGNKALVLQEINGQTANIMEAQDHTGAPIYTLNATAPAALTDLVTKNWVNTAISGINLSLSSLTAAGAGNTIDNLNWAQVWNWSTLNTQVAMTVNANSITSGKVIGLASTSTGLTGDMENITLSGSNAGNTGNLLKLNSSGAASAAIPLSISNAGTGTSLVVANTGTGYAATFSGGNVGINQAAPGAQLEVDSSGNAVIGQIVRGPAAPSVNIWEVDNNGGVPQVYVDSAYKLHGDGSLLTGIGGAATLSSLLAATGGNTIANANNAQVWNWDTLAGGTAMTMASASMTTGSVLALTDSFNNAGSTGNVLTVTTSGALNAATGINISNAGTGTSLKIANTGTGYAATFMGGKVGIGTTTPATALDIAGAYGITGSAVLAFPDGDGTSIAVGANALTAQNAVTLYNTAVGGQALQSDTSGAQNTALGAKALLNNITGSGNVAIGYGSLQNNTASNNTAVGYWSLLGNTSGIQNTAVGIGALQSNNGNSNTAVGLQSLYLNSTGGNNVAVGQFALYANSGSNNNVALGFNSLGSSTAGNNTALGYDAGHAGTANTTGSNNTFIGFQAQSSAANLTNATAIGANAVVGTSNSLVLGNAASVGINNSAPGAQLEVDSSGNGVITEIVKGPAAPTVDIWDIDNNAGTPQVYVDSSYKLHGDGSGLTNVVGAASGIAGAVELSNGATLTSDAANFFYDTTTHRLAIGTNITPATLYVKNPGGLNLLQLDRAGTVKFSVSEFGSTTFSGDMWGSFGTSGNPTYSFSASTNDGMYRAGVHILGFVTNATDVVRIDASGDLGIGNAIVPVDTFSISTAPQASNTHALVNLANTALSGASGNGTYIGVNQGAATADFINYQVTNSTKFLVDKNGNVTGASFTGNGSGLTNFTTSQLPAVELRRVCAIVIGADNGSALADADIAPQGRQCFIPAAATVVEIEVAADAGTPNVVVAKNHAGALTDLSVALATAAAGGIACSNTGGTLGLDGATTCSGTLTTTALSAGDYLETHTATAGGTAKRMSIFVTYMIN